ncbi:PAS domain-containing sensor histidine kinase [Streptomyces paromomycinus]|uniref:Sensor-like histidine kinase SenX3 n=1 Tax=Streptomyces paromomycinus TaxID=92743 RepID=A0A401VUY6_STREY|nr:PAS domain-containing sensor histidine kinase [Streptomyces paromomycinus]GCD40883.1 PAS domain-containing sensor histidine kinase [Streptomyces paromomycinus]
MADGERPKGTAPSPDGPEEAEPGRSPGIGSHGYPIEAVVAAAPDGIVAVDEEGRVRLCNPAAAELFGRPTRELLGLPFGFPLTARGAAELDLVLPSGSGRVVEMRVTATHASGERLYIATLRDVTERHRAQRALEAALARQDTVIAVTAHELRNPLATISVLAHTLRDAGVRLTDAQRTDIANRIIDSTGRLQSLVRKHLAAARIDAKVTYATPQHVPVLEFILEQLGALEEGAPEVDVECRPDVVAYVDRDDLWEMLANYLENAFTYGMTPIRISVTASADHLDIRVHDAGPGVPPDVVPRLFRRFSRAPAAAPGRQGTGLGLWIVRNLARAGGGDAWYEPGAPTGARFCLRLRRAPPNQDHGPDEPRPAS